MKIKITTSGLIVKAPLFKKVDDIILNPEKCPHFETQHTKFCGECGKNLSPKISFHYEGVISNLVFKGENSDFNYGNTNYNVHQDAEDTENTQFYFIEITPPVGNVSGIVFCANIIKDIEEFLTKNGIEVVKSGYLEFYKHETFDY